jgi:hypothetical protein
MNWVSFRRLNSEELNGRLSGTTRLMAADVAHDSNAPVVQMRNGHYRQSYLNARAGDNGDSRQETAMPRWASIACALLRWTAAVLGLFSQHEFQRSNP